MSDSESSAETTGPSLNYLLGALRALLVQERMTKTLLDSIVDQRVQLFDEIRALPGDHDPEIDAVFNSLGR